MGKSLASSQAFSGFSMLVLPPAIIAVQVPIEIFFICPCHVQDDSNSVFVERNRAMECRISTKKIYIASFKPVRCNRVVAQDFMDSGLDLSQVV